MRVLFVTPLYLPYVGGLEVLAGQLLGELRDRGVDVSVLTAHGDETPAGTDVVDGITVLRTRAHEVIEQRDYPGILAVQRETWEHVRALQPDVIHAHDAAPSLWLYARAARRQRPPIVMTLHSVMTEHYASTGGELPGLRTVLRESDWVTGVSPDVVADALVVEPSIADRISLVTTGIAPPPGADAVAPVGDGPARLLAIGRLVETKGFDRAITATALLADRHPDLRLTIAGEGPARADLVALAAELGIADRVAFLGAVDGDRIGALLGEATVVVMPSRFEGLPLVALEAAWMARPVVGAAAPGLAHAVQDGVTGTLVDGDDRALADAVDALLTDRALARAYGAAARELAERQFSLAGCVDEYVRIYDRLLGSGRR